MSSNGSDTESPSFGSSQHRKGMIDTRRAEQNRAAQRAFRQRKERYVKELENKVRDMQGLQEHLEKLEEENAHLRQRLWELEQRSAATAAEGSSSWTPISTASTISTDEPSLQQLPRPPPPFSRPAITPPSVTSTITPIAVSPPPLTTQHHHRYHPYSPSSTLPPPRISSRKSTSNGPTLRLSDQHSQTKLPALSICDEPQAPGSVKGRVLDDLITILRSRNRPPIPSQLDEPTGLSTRSSSGLPRPLNPKQIETTIH